MSWCRVYYITSVILYIYSGYVTASEYYVSAAPNGESCPTDLPCHSLSYYIADYASYFTDDAIFYFLSGTHTLQGILTISNVNNITLQGLDHIEQGFHETVMQSTSVITCHHSNSSGIKFTNSSDVVLKSLTIANCGFNWLEDYSVSLYFVNIKSVTLEWVSVQNSSGDGLVLFNAYDVLIANSSFANNGDLETFVGNAYIFYQDKINRLSRVNISKSNFTLGLGYSIHLKSDNDNEAEIIIESCILSNNIAEYGGGMEMFLVGGGNIKFNNCTICNNIAHHGGGMYIGSNANGSIDISNCNIYNNTAQVNGGGVSMYSLGDGIIEFINCIIYDNTAHFDGGGMYINSFTDSGSIIKFSNCTISNNSAYFASGLVLRSLQTTSTSTNSFHLTNVTFHFNKVINTPDVCQKGYRSVVVLLNIENITFDHIEVSNHNTTGLVGVNSLITFDGHNMFVNNSGIYGGGIALYELSQLLLNQNTNISFINNHASKSGGGIFVSQFLDVDIATRCSFKVIPYHYPNDTKTVLYFVNNTADISGDVLYGGKIDDCTSTLYFDHLFHYPQQTGLSAVSSDPIQVCFCESKMPNCSITNISIFAIPGIDVNVSLAAVGSRNDLTQGVINLTSSNNSSIVKTNNNRLNVKCTNVTFKLTMYSLLKTTQVYITLERPINIEHVHDNTKVIEVTIESCPNGFVLINGTCFCRSELNSPSINCDINTQIITRDGDMWIGYENDSNCLIVYSNCPFDYCNNSNISFTLTYHNKQCLYNRSGILCGKCSEGLSLMLGSNQCEKCTNNNIVFIIPIAVAGIALVAFVFVLNLTVSVGTINGLIFYANVVKMYEHIFFPNGPVTFLSWFISWVNLDLGINTCVYNGMDSCSKAWLQFFFPTYILLITLIILLVRYSSKVVCLGKQVIPVLATMILLSYTKLIHTAVQALYFIRIPCSDEMKNTLSLVRWSFDANIHYLQGCHLSLFLFSLAVLILLIIPYTFYLLTIPLFEGPLSKYMCCCKKLSTYIKYFFDAYGGPYKDKCRFWTGFLLLVRVILALVVSLNIEATISIDVLISLLIVIIFIYLILKGIYRHFPLDYLEAFFILNLIFMAYMNTKTSTDNYNNSKGQVSSIVLVSISFVVFCGIISYHVWSHLLKSCLHQPIAKIMKIIKKRSLPSTSNDLELPLMHSRSPDLKRSMSVVSMEVKQESTVFDDYY